MTPTSDKPTSDKPNKKPRKKRSVTFGKLMERLALKATRNWTQPSIIKRQNRIAGNESERRLEEFDYSSFRLPEDAPRNFDSSLALTMRASGMTYGHIGNYFNISRQRIEQKLIKLGALRLPRVHVRRTLADATWNAQFADVFTAYDNALFFAQQHFFGMLKSITKQSPDLTQRGISRRAGYSSGLLANYQRDPRIFGGMRMRTLSRLALAMNCTLRIHFEPLALADLIALGSTEESAHVE